MNKKFEPTDQYTVELPCPECLKLQAKLKLAEDGIERSLDSIRNARFCTDTWNACVKVNEAAEILEQTHRHSQKGGGIVNILALRLKKDLSEGEMIYNDEGKCMVTQDITFIATCKALMKKHPWGEMTVNTGGGFNLVYEGFKSLLKDKS